MSIADGALCHPALFYCLSVLHTLSTSMIAPADELAGPIPDFVSNQ
jgi:hypothetical protein